MTKVAHKLYGKDGDRDNDDLYDLTDQNSLKKPKKRVSYENNWKTQKINYDPKTNSNKDDVQALSNKIRPKNTIFVEPEKGVYMQDFTKSANQEEDY